MSAVATIVGGNLIGGLLSGQAQTDAANTAANAQTNASRMSIEEQRRQFEAIQKLLAPYINAGTGALGMQQNYLGLNGQQAQQDFINGISSGPELTSMVNQGENALLQNASATGGLRGGNTASALAQFRPQMLNQLLQQRFAQLGGLSSMGQNAAAGVGNAGQNAANQISAQYGQMGAAQAGSALAAGQANANMWNNLAGAGGTLGTLHLLGKF